MSSHADPAQEALSAKCGGVNNKREKKHSVIIKVLDYNHILVKVQKYSQ